MLKTCLALSRNLFLSQYSRTIQTKAKVVGRNMKSTLTISKTEPSLYLRLVAEHLKGTVSFEWGSNTTLRVNNLYLYSPQAISCHLVRSENKPELYGGANPLDQAQVDHWIWFGLNKFGHGDFMTSVKYTDEVLSQKTFLVGSKVTLADMSLYAGLHSNRSWNIVLSKGLAGNNLERWYQYISSLNEFKVSVADLPNVRRDANQGKQSAKKDNKTPAKEEGGKFVNLPGAKMNEVVVRFPPEASGYLHVGHAKAALLNQHYQQSFNGKLIMRFDDTNPAKENTEFEKIILEDLKLLNVNYNVNTFTSNHFDGILNYAGQMIKKGAAYVDDTDPALMKEEREKRQESKHRNSSVEDNLKRWEEMKQGTVYGKTCCLRAKIDMNSDNGCLRDPTIYRCKDEPHPRTGDKFKVYPTYDFACPIVDSVEGVTHALRTTEYHDRDAQYYWFIDTLGIRRPHIWDYSRLNLTHTVLSKRKLAWFVDNGYVTGWDDPRFPTVRGVLRRGLTVEALREFIILQGSAKSVNTMSWDKLWTMNKKLIDPVAPRYTGIGKTTLVPVTVENTETFSKNVPKHPKNTEVGHKEVHYSRTVYIEGEDAATLEKNQLVTMINWGNMLVGNVTKQDGKIVGVSLIPKLDNTDYKKTVKLTWLAENTSNTPAVAVHYDNLISKAVIGKDEDFKQYIGHKTVFETELICDPSLAQLKKGEIIQLQRRGYYICDKPYCERSPYTGFRSPCVLINIPDGRLQTQQPQSSPPVKVPQQQSLPPAGATTGVNEEELLAKIADQGNTVRNLKTQKADKDTIKAAVDVLLGLKKEYKDLTGNDPPPGGKPNAPKTQDPKVDKLLEDIHNQGTVVRNLKSRKAEKSEITAAVDILLAHKAEYKKLTGKDPPVGGKPPASKQAPPNQPQQTTPSNTTTMSSTTPAALEDKIKAQGDKVRTAKAAGTPKDELQGLINELLKLKADYKSLTGKDPPQSAPAKQGKAKGKQQQQQKKEEPAKQLPEAGQTRLGLECKKLEDLPGWYTQVITKSEMIEYYNVSGCYILRPWAYSIWEHVKDWFDAEIKKIGVENCYFPMFVSQSALEQEKTHIADFAPEVAWVTKAGSSDLAEPIAIRPTSETVMYPSYSSWVQSYRDLPIRLNQWCNVVRWEFKHPQPFLRTREFLWQEGHSAFATREDAVDEVYTILELYYKVYKDLLAIPTIKGRKTEKEKFAGGDFTTTVEGYIGASGRAIQGATSHHLGQNFSKMFDISFEDPEKNTTEKLFAHQNSWGITTRTIGVVVMVHGDDTGLVLPPRVAQIQVVLIPCGINNKNREELVAHCKTVSEKLNKAGVRAKGDYRMNYSSGWKFNHWELKGVPIRMEIGPRDMKTNQVCIVRRDTSEKSTLQLENLEDNITSLLDTIHDDMYNRALKERDANLTVSKDWDEFCALLNNKKIIMAPFCGEIPCEDTIKKDSARADQEVDANAPSMGAKSLCIPFEQPGDATTETCINPKCGKPAKYFTLFGRSY